VSRRSTTPAAVGMVLGSISVLQLGAGLAVTLFDELGPAGTAFARQVIAAGVILALVRPRVRGRSAADWRLAVTFGVTLGLMNWMVYTAIDQVGLGIAVTLEFLGPLGVAVVGSRRLLDGVWVVLAAVGVVILTAAPSHTKLPAGGVLAALVAAACWALYIVLSTRTGARFGGATGLALAMPISGLVTAPAGIAQAGTALLAPRELALAAVVALACSVIPYSLELEALRRLPARAFGIFMSLEPAAAALVGLVVLGQALDALDVLAIGCVVIASAGAARRAPARAPDPA
jgi:inner membrane transporter RhtA